MKRFRNTLVLLFVASMLVVLSPQIVLSSNPGNTLSKGEFDLGGGDFTVKGEKLFFSPDARTLVIGGGNFGGEVKDRQTGRQISQLPGSFDVAVSPDGNRVALAGRQITVLDLKTNKELMSMPGNNDGIMPVAFSPDGSQLAIADNNISAATVAIWDIAKREKRLMQVSGKRFGSLAFSRDGKRLAVGVHSYGIDPVPIQIVDSSTGKLLTTLNGHRSAVRAIGFSGTGDVLASAGHDGLAIWKIASGEPKFFPPRTGKYTHVDDRPWSLAISPDGKTVAVGMDHSIQLFDLASARLLKELHPVGFVTWGVAFSPDGSTLGSISGGGPRTVEFWNCKSGAHIGESKRHAGPVYKVEFLDANRLASVGDDNRLKIWNLTTQTLAGELSGNNFAVSPGGTRAFGSPARLIDLMKNFSVQKITGVNPDSSVVGWYEGGIAVGDFFYQKIVCYDNLGKQTSLLKLGKPLNGLDVVHTLVAQGNGKEILFGGGRGRSHFDATDSGFLGVWNPPSSTWKSLLKLPLPVQRIVKTSSGKLLAVAKSYNDFAVYDVATGAELTRVPNRRFSLLSYALSPNGKYLAFGGEESTVLLWDLEKKEFQKLAGKAVDGKPKQLPAPADPTYCGVQMGPNQAVGAVVFSPDGSTLATAGGNGGVELFSVKSRQWLGRFDCNHVSALAYSADGKRLVAGIYDGSIRVWDLVGQTI